MKMTRAQLSAFGARLLSSRWFPLSVLTATLALTGVAWILSRAHAQSEAQAQFESAASHIAELTHQRMLMQEAVLRGGAAVFTATGSVSREDWRKYVKQLDLKHRFPGMQAMGVALRVRSADLPTHVSDMRRQGFPNYHVWPAGTRHEYTAGTFIEPLAGRNLRAVGYDMSSEQTLRVALDKARDTGKETVSSQSTRFKRPGPDSHMDLLMYTPVYGTGAIPTSIARRRSALRGYIFASFDGDEMVRSIVREWPTEMHCGLSDTAAEGSSGSDVEQGSDSDRGTGADHSTGADNEHRTTEPTAAKATTAEAPAFTTTRTSEIAGHPWVLSCQSPPHARAISSSRPTVVLAAGIPISLLLFVVSYGPTALRVRAQAIATQMTSTLRQDVEEKQRLEANLRQAQKLAAIGMLGRGIAQDFNDIAGEILGHGELARSVAPPDDPVRQHLDDMISAGERARLLVEHLLTFSRSGRGERVPLEVQSVVAEMLDRLRAPEDVRFGRELHAAESALVGDPAQIQQVVVNLCTNAVEAMPSGGVLTVYLDLVTLEDSRIYATAELHAGDYIRLRVRDSGTGIPPELLERVFDPFFTTKPDGTAAGLGLTIVQSIVSDLGGAVDIHSEPASGTTVTVLLPRHGNIGQFT